MNLTKKKEGELIAHLRRGIVSIPEIQFQMKISYKEARSLIEYAQKHKWIGGCGWGIEHPILDPSFARKNLPEDTCKRLYDKLAFDDLKVLYYLGNRFSATFQDILKNVDNDRSDMLDALENLTSYKLIFRHEGHFYCKISRKSVHQIQKNETTSDEKPVSFRHHFAH